MVDSQFFLSYGGSGSSLVYDAAILQGGTKARQRLFWCSRKFQRRHAELYNMLHTSARADASVWHEVDTEKFAAEVERDNKRPAKQRRPLQQIALVHASEVMPEGVKSAFTPEEFIRKFALVRTADSAVGACGL